MGIARKCKSPLARKCKSPLARKCNIYIRRKMKREEMEEGSPLKASPIQTARKSLLDSTNWVTASGRSCEVRGRLFRLVAVVE